MIAKISTSSSPRGALIYNYSKLEEGEAKLLQTNKMLCKPDELVTVNELAYMFERRAAINRNTKEPFVHISLNPSPDDVLSDEQLTQIADEYMQKMGYGNQPYIVFKHEDIERHHLHIVTTNIDAQGKKINDSNNFYNSKKITNELERKYKLHPADIKKDNKVWIPDKVDATKNVSNQVRNIVKHLTKNYRFQSLNEYKTLLSVYNIDLQEIKGDAAGKTFEGLIYSATNDEHNKVANPIKSSVLGKFAGAKNLQTIYDKSAVALDTATKNRIKTILAETMRSAKTENDLLATLKNKNIDLVLRKNDTGRIYGATIIDHQSKSVLNGSRLGKEFSANKFQELFNPIEKSATTEQVQTQTDVPPSAALEQIEQQPTLHQPLFSFTTIGGMPLFAGGGGGSTTKRKKKKKKKNLSL